MSKAYISQVKHGKRPPSEKLIQALMEFDRKSNKRNGVSIDEAIALFLKSRREGLSSQTINNFYKCYLEKVIPILGLAPKSRAINGFLNALGCSEGGKHAYFRAMRAL